MGQYDYPALEGGWGWVVVLSGFCIHVLTRGCLFSTGILFSEWTTYFETSKSEGAWIGSIATGCALMIGPLASKLVERFGCRMTAFAGGILTFIGLFSSSWANSVFSLCLTYGVLAGTGMGVTYLCGVVAVGEYFDRRRSLAFGIASSGAGFGAAVMAILQQVLIDEYGWRGSLILLAGLSGLHLLVFGALLRPLSSSINWVSEERKKALKNHKILHSSQAYKAWVSYKEEDHDFSESYNSSPTSSSNSINDLSPGERMLDTPQSAPRLFTSSMSPSMYLRRKQMISLDEKLSDAKSDQLNPAIPNPVEILIDNEEGIESSTASIARSTLSIPEQLKITSSDALYLSNLSIASSRKVVENLSTTRTFGRSTMNYNLSNESLPYEGIERLSSTNVSMIDANTNDDSRVLTNPLFLVLAINQFFTGLGIMIPFIHLSQKAILMGFTAKQAAYLISIIGIGNVIGKISLGMICDMKWSNTVIVFVVSQFGLATSVAIYPIASGYVVIVLASISFGFFYGNYCAIPSLLVQFVGLNNLAEAIGYINFLEGASGIIGPPLAGAIYDSSKSYNVAFAVSAGFLLLSFVVLALYPILKRKAAHVPRSHGLMEECNRLDKGVKLDYNENNIEKIYF